MEVRKKEINKFFIFPDLLPGGKMGGFHTRDDITQMRGFYPIGQNMKMTDSRTMTNRDGFQLVGTTEGTAVTPIKRAWVFERRDGVQIEMRAYDTKLEARVVGVMTDFELLKGGFTAALEFAYGVISGSSLTTSFVQYCNGTDDIQRWTGVYGMYASDNGSNTITIEGSTSLADLGFTATGTIIIGEAEITYTGLSSQTFTGCSAVPSSPTVGDIIFQSPITTGFTAELNYQVGIAHDGRMHGRNDENDRQSVALYSKLDDPFNWTTGAIDGDGGAKEIEQGGPITAFGKFGKTLLIFKRRLIKTLEFVSNSNRIDVPKYNTLKPADDKSTTVGAIGQKSTFHGPNAVYFVTDDKELLELNFNANITFPELISISDAIRPTFQAGVHDDAAGIVYESKVFYAYKQDENSSYNDTVIVFDLVRREWWPPIVGWNVSDWTITNGKLHWHSATGPNTYEVITQKTDAGEGFTSTLRTWSEHFDFPYLQKTAGYVYLEIYMTEGTEVTAAILYDEDGYSGQETYILRADEDTNMKFNANEYNPFGFSAFGTQRFGSNPDVSGAKKYRYLLELKGNIEFYTIALQLSSDQVGAIFEPVRFGWFLKDMYLLPAKRYLKNTA